MPRTFEDTQERIWTVVIDTAMAGQLREYHRINVAGLLFRGDHFHAVTADRSLFLPALYTICYAQCQPRKMGQPELEAALDSRAHQAAIGAFGGALWDYMARGEQQRFARLIVQQRRREQVRRLEARTPRPAAVTQSRAVLVPASSGSPDTVDGAVIQGRAAPVPGLAGEIERALLGLSE